MKERKLDAVGQSKPRKLLTPRRLVLIHNVRRVEYKSFMLVPAVATIMGGNVAWQIRGGIVLRRCLAAGEVNRGDDLFFIYLLSNAISK